jgi:hypothetical protein
MFASDLDAEDLEGVELAEFVAVDPTLSPPGQNNDLYEQYGPGQLGGGLYSDDQVDPDYDDEDPRDWAILEDCKDRLEATGVFDGVYLGDPKDNFSGSDEGSVAFLHLQEWTESGYQDTLQGRLTKWTLILVARDADPSARDRRLSRLFRAAKTALDHRCLANYTYPDYTVLARARWEKAEDDERRLTVTGEWGYDLDDSEDF